MNLSKRVVAIVSFLAVAHTASASVFLGGSNDGNKGTFGGMSGMTGKPQTSCRVTNMYQQKMSKDENQRQLIARTIRRQINPTANGAAMAIPGYGVAEQVFVGGFSNFLSVYNIVITARVLFSWFPQAQGMAILQPVYQVTDPYLNLFRGLIPPVFGLDLSTILAFVVLSVLGNVATAVGAEITPTERKRLEQSSPFPVKPYYNKNMKSTTPSIMMSAQ